MSNPPLPDRDEILRAVRRIAAPDQVVELRALNVSSDGRRPYTLSGYFDDFERLATAAAKIRGAQGVYITLNPPNPAVLARCANRLRQPGAGAATSDSDIIARRWLPIDADPIRPAEISASEAEHEAALATARRIRAALAELGWPEPLLADSGNGGHLLYRVDLPVLDLTGLGTSGLLPSAVQARPVRSGDLVERVLAALAARFDDEQVRVDVKVFNPARIWKLYGTVARKGDHTPDRPHRLARLLEGPEEPLVVPRELLEAMARGGDAETGRGDDAERERGGDGETRLCVPVSPSPRVPFSLDSWLVERNVPVSPPQPWRNGRRWIFPVCPWDPSHLGSAYIVELPGGAIAAGCHHNSCTGKGWSEVRQLYDCGLPVADLKTSVRRSPGPDPQSAINNLQSAIASWPIVHEPAERRAAEERAIELIASCASLDRAGVLQVVAALRGRGLSAGFLRQWQSAVREQRRRLQAASGKPAPPDEYEAEDGRIYRVAWEITATGEPQPHRSVVADFVLCIVEETVAEDGRVWFTLAGEAADGRPLRLELMASEFADDRLLQVAVTGAAGPCCPVRANMLRHLRPAIQLLTPGEVPRLRRYDRTGWEAGIGGFGEERSGTEDSPSPCPPVPASPPPRVFLLPGREPPGVVVRLPRKLPYRVEAGGDRTQGLAALESALNAADPRRTAILVAAMLGAPLARPAGLEGERYGVFLSGRTGSLKTSTAQALMCLYGAGFLADEHLLKLGEGATRNAIMGYASHVHDLPLLVDNYKPSTGDGARGFTNLLHNLLEGGDRDRMTRTAELRESRPVHCWPVFTGEDVPDADTAGLARLLIVPFEPLRGDPAAQDASSDRLAALTRAQAQAAHLPAVGEAWLAWLEGEGWAIAAEAGARFPGMRSRWLEFLRETQAEMTNPLRVASSLACNELAWEVLCCHPDLGALAARYGDAHTAGLLLLAGEMAGRTVVSLEAARFLAVLRELLATGRCELIGSRLRGRKDLEDVNPKGGDRKPVGDDAASGSSLRRATDAGIRPDRSSLARTAWPGPETCQVSSSADGRPGRGRNTPQGSDAGVPPERTLGWECPDGSIYLLPELARREVERVLGPGGLNGVSSRTLHEQLSELGMIASHDPSRFTRKVREGGRLHNVLHLRPEALEG